MYLGLLYPTEEYKVYAPPSLIVVLIFILIAYWSYGYVTNTKNKFIAIIADEFLESDIPVVIPPFRKLALRLF